MQNIYVKTYFPKQRSVALAVVVGLLLTLLYLLGNSTKASGATVSASGGSCTQTVGSSTGVSVAVVNGKCVVTFATAGTTTWTVPTGVGSVRTLVVGAGGGNGGGSPGGINTLVQFNDAGSFGANLGFSFDKVTGILSVPGLTVANLATVGNITGIFANGNSNVSIPSANGNVNISAVGNANILVITGTGANIAGTLNVTGNTTVGNLFSSGSGGNLSNLNVISANTFIASGNITAGNINTTGSGGNIGNVISSYGWCVCVLA